jgi:hypothetical protein
MRKKQNEDELDEDYTKTKDRLKDQRRQRSWVKDVGIQHDIDVSQAVENLERGISASQRRLFRIAADLGIEDAPEADEY